MKSRKVEEKMVALSRATVRTAVVGVLFLAMVAGILLVNVIKDNLGLDERPIELGATFSKPYAESLGLDWKKAYIDTLDDLGVRRLRIPAYWNEIEPEPGIYNFSNVDWMLEEARKRDAKVLLAVGRKLPRWPECHMPPWTQDMNESLVQTRVLAMIEVVVRRYASNDAVDAWQVENEPLFEFGICPPPDREFLKHEVAVVRALDDRPVVITESGELSTWVGAAGIADIVGISTYRNVWDKYVGYVYWPVGPRYYTRRAQAISTLVDGIIISELQAEPWGAGGEPLMSINLSKQRTLMNPSRLRDNVTFARRIGFPQAYLWGIEWWYWMKTKDQPEMWEEGKRLFRNP